MFCRTFILMGLGLAVLCRSAISAHAVEAPNPHATTSDFVGSEIESLFSSGGSVPTHLSDWKALVEKVGPPVTHVFIPFSGSPAPTSFEEPRVVFSNSPRLFIGAIPRLDGKLELEFLSWNTNRGEYDFGILKDGKLVPADRKKCMLCHKTGGPIFPSTPWGNTTGGVTTFLGHDLSRAILSKLIEHAPAKLERFKKYVDAKTNVDEPPEEVTHEGFRIFGTASDASTLERLVENGTLRMQANLLLKNLPLAKRETVGLALTRTAFSRPTTASANFRKELDGQIASSESDLPPDVYRLLRQSPIFKDFIPAQTMDLPPPGFPGHGAPVGSREHLLGINEYLRKEQKSAYPDASRPSSPEAFREATRASENSPVPTFMEGDLRHRFEIQTDIWKDQHPIADRFWATVKEAGYFKRNQFPSIAELQAALQEFRAGRPLRRLSESSAQPVASRPPATPRQTGLCLSCHDGTIPGIQAPFDLENETAWRAALSDPRRRTEALRWLNRSEARIATRRMPPPDAEEAIGFNINSGSGKRLLERIRALKKEFVRE